MAKSTLKSEKKPQDFTRDLEFARTAKPYIKIEPTLLMILNSCGVNPNKATATLVEYFNKVRQYDFNYNYFGHQAPVWVLREQFPGTDIFFKITGCVVRHMAFTPLESESEPFLVMSASLVCARSEKSISPSYDEVQAYLLEQAEFNMLGINEEPKEFIKAKFKKPRKMSPKGYK